MATKTKTQIRRCGNCNRQGHNSRTCSRAKYIGPKVKVSVPVRRCGNCGKGGHNARTCRVGREMWWLFLYYPANISEARFKPIQTIITEINKAKGWDWTGQGSEMNGKNPKADISWEAPSEADALRVQKAIRGLKMRGVTATVQKID